MTAQRWLDRNKSLEAAHHRYGSEFEVAYSQFRTRGFEQSALWGDAENVGENIMAWFRQRQC